MATNSKSTNYKPTCAEVYAGRHDELMAKIKRLQLHAASHTVDHEANPTNWGYVGDLDHMIKMVDQALGIAQ